jgi:hypothetical protein
MPRKTTRHLGGGSRYPYGDIAVVNRPAEQNVDRPGGVT